MDVIPEMYCATCSSVTPFEQCPATPPTAAPSTAATPIDDERDDCPEWACTRCGEAIVLAPLTLLAA